MNVSSAVSACRTSRRLDLMVLAFAFLLVSLNLVTAVLATASNHANGQGDPHVEVSASRSAPLQCQVPSMQSATIGYQLHSWDDLREWQSGLKKGGRWLKVDPHYMNATFCQSQSHASSDPRGCFLLSHDIPLADVPTYNTTEEIISVLSEPWAAPYVYPSEEDGGLYIALCFKIDEFSPCDNSTAAADWLSLVDDLLASYQDFVTSTGASVTFILDGASTPGANRTCLDQRWRPLVSTYIIEDDGLGPMLSNNANNGSDRFQIMNTHIEEPPKTLEWLKEEASYSYGKFVDSSYPWLNWEPSDQFSILKTCDFYLDEGILHDPGFKFAINIDPVALEVYSASRSGRGWNACVDVEAARPFVVSPVTSDGQPWFLIIYTDKVSGDLSFVSSSAPSGDLQPFQQPQLLPTPSVNESLASVDTFVSRGTTYLLCWYTSCHYDVFSVMGDGNDVFVSLVFSSAVLSSCPSENCAVGLMTAALSLESWDLSPVSEEACLYTGRGIQGAAVDALLVASSIDAGECIEGEVAALVTYWDKHSLFTSLACIGTAGGSVPKVYGTGKAMDVGQRSSLSLAVIDEAVVVMEVHTDGFCWNSHKRNTRSTVKVCDQEPRGTPYILTYNYGLLSDWVGEFIDQEGYAGVCCASVLHGTYDSGDYPDVLLFEKTDGTLGVVEVHEGMPLDLTSVLPDVEECGVAVPSDLLLIDAWSLPHL